MFRALMALARQLTDLFWPFWSCAERDRKRFRLHDPEDERPADMPVPAPADCRRVAMFIRPRRTVRSTQPPSKRSLNGGRRK